MSYRAPLYTLPTGITFDPVIGFVGTAVDTTYAEPATVVTLTDQGSATANTTALQNAINTAAAASTGGTTIVLPVGSTYYNITLPARSGDGGWIYIVSSARNLLPPPQAGDVPGDYTTRVTAADAAYMPKIINHQDFNIGETAIAVECMAAAHHYRFVGIDISTLPDKGSANLVFLSVQNQISGGVEVPGTGMDNEANFPHHIGMDRCYLHGQPTRFDMQRAVFLDADYGFVVGCHITDVQHSGADAQAVLIGRGHGPYKVCNNYMIATGETIMVGGVNPGVSGVIPSDIEIRHNDCPKPLTWNVYDPSWDGQTRDIKNTWELKIGQRILFEGNVGTNCWFGDGGQYFMVNFKAVNQSDGSATWLTTSDVTFCYNKLLNVYGGISVAGNPEGVVAAKAHRVDLYENLIVHGDPAILGPGIASQLATLAVNSMGANFVFRRNTCVGYTANALFFTSSPVSQDVTVTDNVLRRTTTWGGAQGGVKGDGTYDPAAPNDGSAIFNAYTTSHTFTGNGFYDAAGGDTTQRASYTTAPDTNALIDTLEADVYVDASNADVTLNNYRLKSGLFAGVATDGTQPGANIDQIEVATANVVAGAEPPPPSGPLTYVPIVF